jgi:amino acid adenylation domain-containing protein
VSSDTSAEAALAAERERLLAELLAAEGLSTGSDPDRIPARAPGAPVPLTFAQEVLWLLDRATPGLAAYNTPLARRVRGPLDLAALERAMTALVARHEALRTVFVAQGDGGAQQVLPAAPVAVALHDVSALPEGERLGAAVRALRTVAEAPFDLAREGGFRAAVARLAPDDHVLLLLAHHIVSDAWSFGLMLADLSKAYQAAVAGGTPDLPRPALDFGDFAAWQRTTLAGDALAAKVAWWRDALAGAEELVLPTDKPRPATPGFGGARRVRTLAPAQVAALKAAAEQRGGTLYMALLVAYTTVLRRHAGQDDLVVGSAVAARTPRETEGMVGYFSQALPMRVRATADDSLDTLLPRVAGTVLGAFDHVDVPVETLVLELQRNGQRPSHAPLFNCVLTMQEGLGADLQLPGCTATPLDLEYDATKFDLTLLVGERAEGLELALWYRTDLFTAEGADRILGQVERVIAGMVASPATPLAALPLASATEAQQLAGWHETAADLGAPTTITALFERQVARVGNRLAVVAPSASAAAHGSVAGSVALTYPELEARANQLAHALLAQRVTRGQPVGLLLDRSADAIVGLLGILKAGGAYMPLAQDAPAARLARQVADAGARVVVTDAAHAALVPPTATALALDGEAAALQARPDTPPAVERAPTDVAYVLFTSGSTGTPKGVAVTHANVVHYTRSVTRALGLDADEPADGRARQFGLASTLAADLGNTSLFPALLRGATLHVLGKDVATEPARFALYMAAHQLDVLKMTPNHVAALVAGRTGAELAEVLPRQWLVTGGEALPLAFARSVVQAGRCRLLNHYGPTETTVGALTFEASLDAVAEAERLGALTVPIGRPLANMRAVVVDGRGQEQPVGMPGELWLAGAGVTIGYVGRDDLTAAAFTTWQGARAYRTGDRVRRLANGAIEFLGRADDQVKVRGFRVELGEVEQVLRLNPGVAQAAVVLRTDEGQEPMLVAYVVAKAAGYAVSHADRPTPEKLREWAAASLPAHMVPEAVVLLEALPLTANGKLDRRALPAPGASASAGAAFAEPQTDVERQLATIWAEVLKKEQVGRTDNFLALGGHSLLAIRVLGRISKAFGVRLPLRTLFESPTVEALARAVEVAKAGQ